MSFIATVDHLQRVLSSTFQRRSIYCKQHPNAHSIPWSWVAVHTAQLLNSYPTGLTDAIVLSELELLWEKKCEHIAVNRIEKMQGAKALMWQLISATVKRVDPINQSIWQATLVDDSAQKITMFLAEKYDAWIQEQAFPSVNLFTKERNVSFFCTRPASVSESWDGENSVAVRRIRIPPADLCIWHLRADDGPWVKEVFCDTYATVIPPLSMAASHKTHRLWLKVIHVEEEADLHIHPNPILKSQFDMSSQLHEKRRRVDIYVLDCTNDLDHALISLYDTQCNLSPLFQRDCYIGLFNPKFAAHLTLSQASQTDMVFECGHDTILFSMTAEDALSAGLARPDHQASAVKKPSQSTRPAGFWQESAGSVLVDVSSNNDLRDCRNVVPRILVRDLQPSMVNVTLSGCVIAKAGNHPLVKDGKTMDRFAVRLEDESGTTDITLWEEVGQHIKKIDIGQNILITGLSTSMKQSDQSPATAWFVNGSKVCGTKIYNASTLACMLDGRFFRQLSPLQNIQGEGQWQTEARIVGWDLHGASGDVLLSSESEVDECGDSTISDYIVSEAHVQCLQPLDGDRCHYCKEEGPRLARTHTYNPRKRPNVVSKGHGLWGWIEWKLDDGQGAIYAYGGDKQLLNCQARHFAQLSYAMQQKLMNTAIGKRMLFSIIGDQTGNRIVMVNKNVY
ncbi:hypothetical protein BC940DRAFT_296794 [Gongronella butleri]|nr:hypothetical protein BC940DRAFT_296794 [Gongronella butleri]